MTWLRQHVGAHPVRVLATVTVIMFFSLMVAATALFVAIETSKANDVKVCLQVNELRRQIYIAAADLNVPPVVRARFLPTQNCEAVR